MHQVTSIALRPGILWISSTTYIVHSSHVSFEKLDFLTIESAKSEIEGAHASNFLLTTDCDKEIFNSSKNFLDT